MIIKKIFEKNFDEEVHSALLKFGRGNFSNRYLIDGKKQKDKWVVKTSSEFANFFVKKCLEGQGKLRVSGAIISTMDLSEDINFEIKKKSNFQGIKKIIIDTEVNSEQILNLMKKYPRAFFALSFETDKNILKIKTELPTSPKPKLNPDKIPKADFCNLKTTDKKLLEELFWDIGLGWNEIKISHTIKVEKIIYPKNFEKMKPEEIREKSKRIGILTREIEVDGVKKIEEGRFEA